MRQSELMRADDRPRASITVQTDMLSAYLKSNASLKPSSVRPQRGGYFQQRGGTENCDSDFE
jgi:hypothetical protein